MNLVSKGHTILLIDCEKHNLASKKAGVFGRVGETAENTGEPTRTRELSLEFRPRNARRSRTSREEARSGSEMYYKNKGYDEEEE